MAKNRTSIAMQNKILELRHSGVPIRKISESLKISRKTVRKFLRYKTHDVASGVLVERPLPLTDSNTMAIQQSPGWLQELDWLLLLAERAKGVPIKVLWSEAKAQGCPVQCWAFGDALKKLANRITPPNEGAGCVRFMHKAGEKVLVDYCDGVPITDPRTRKTRKTQLFVSVLPFSGKVYAEFSLDQKQHSFISCIENMWKYFGGVCEYLVCDNLKSGVLRADLYDPDVNPTFSAYAKHAGFVVLPTRPCKPRDKGSVERHVGIIQQDFFFQVRNHVFYSLDELNKALKAFLTDLNAREMKEYGVSRNHRFQEEIKHLKPCPVDMFESEQWKKATVHGDYHVQVERHFYSVPYRYLHKIVSVKITGKAITIIDTESGELIATHVRFQSGRGLRSTDPYHWPDGVRQQMTFDIQSALKQAKHLGPQVFGLVNMLSVSEQALQYLRRIQGLLRLYYSKKLPYESLEYACSVGISKNISKLYIIKEIAWKYTQQNRPLHETQKAPLRPMNSVYQDPQYQKDTQICCN